MIKYFFHTYLYNRSPVEWVGVIPKNRKNGMLFGKPVQIIGGKTWTISFMRTGEVVELEEFWKDAVN